MLGVLTVLVDGKRINDDLGPAGRLLSGYLFEYIDQTHRRERLVDMFWGRLEPDRARAAFNTALWRLRKLLALEPKSEGGRNLRTYGSEIILEKAPWLTIDTHSFIEALRHSMESRPAEEAAARVAVLESAIRNYSGPFLDGEDADWILEERERLHSLYVRAESELMRCFGAEGSYEDAIAAARRILVADPFRESVIRSLALLFVLNGQRAKALRYYERWHASFRAELGIDPMPQTVHLMDDVRSGTIFESMDALRDQFFCPKELAMPNKRQGLRTDSLRLRQSSP
jgi:DNA-binding SARP family transcriptional activator